MLGAWANKKNEKNYTFPMHFYHKTYTFPRNFNQKTYTFPIKTLITITEIASAILTALGATSCVGA